MKAAEQVDACESMKSFIDANYDFTGELFGLDVT